MLVLKLASVIRVPNYYNTLIISLTFFTRGSCTRKATINNYYGSFRWVSRSLYLKIEFALIIGELHKINCIVIGVLGILIRSIT